MNAKAPMMVHFPIMHPALATAESPDSVCFFDPGIVNAKDSAHGRYYRSPDLVYEDAQARQFLEDSLHFGSQFKHTADMAYFKAGPVDDFFTGSMQDIKSELLSPGAQEARRTSKALADAQLILLLGFHLEQRMIELETLGTSIDTSVLDFEENLGLDKEDRAALHSVLPQVGSRSEFSPDWRRLLLPFLRFIPAASRILLTDPVIISDLSEQGMCTRPCTDEDLSSLFPGGIAPEGFAFSMGNASGRELAGWAGVAVKEDVADRSFIVVTMTVLSPNPTI